MSDINLEIKLYGAFRKFGQSVNISIASGSKIKQVKEALADALGELVNSSVLADNDIILNNDDILEQDTTLSILPPVCGG